MAGTRIKGIEGYTLSELRNDVLLGGRFVIFQYTISVIVMTFKRPSSIYFIPSGHSSFSKHAKHSAVSLLFGWWGFPWGPIYTLGSLGRNLSGGKDVTQAVMDHLVPQQSGQSIFPDDLDSLEITKQ